uniref:AAA+ ATPase domain-containing protein n=1 Tax=Auxenochlorella protothecoides TaxID=3075 RepID=A0A1D1ZR49_AUXPR
MPPRVTRPEANAEVFKAPLPRQNRKVLPTLTLDRFDQQVLGGQLWLPACSSLAPPPTSIPLEFDGVEEYVSVMEPLVLAEARESLRGEWAEACASGAALSVTVAGLEHLEGGWARLRLAPHGPVAADKLRYAATPGRVAVLSSEEPPRSGALAWAARGPPDPPAPESGSAGGLGPRSGGDAGHHDDGSPGAQEDARSSESCGSCDAPPGKRARRSPSAPPAGVHMVAGTVSQGRGGSEVEVRVHAACESHARGAAPGPCSAALRALEAGGPRRVWWLVTGRPLVSQRREFDAVHRAVSMSSALLPYVLRPSLLQVPARAYADQELRQRLWPPAARTPAFIRHLQQQYDYSQLVAIEMAACHLGGGGPDAHGTVAAPPLPFTLIQGPPGTGKTHTVKGVLNVWHLVAYQAYFDGLIAAALPGTAPTAPRPAPASCLNNAGSNLVEALSTDLLSGLGAAVVKTRPRILVCTPSNAACDELLARVMAQGFCDGSGGRYSPNVVRVGADVDGVISPAVRGRSIGRLVDQHRTMIQSDWQRRFADASRRRQHAGREIELLEAALTRCADEAERMELAKRLIDRYQVRLRFSQDLERLEAARTLVWGAREEWRVREAEQAIETSLLLEAEMVFTTLSSTQRKIFQLAAAQVPFRTVLIDEAGQASEIAALQPLGFGAERVVLVGDPQQLPATILSELGREMEMERSLFERLQRCGAPVSMLSVQYRMHPAIRQFPSAYFYNNKLEDAASVLERPDEPYYAHPLMKPYVVFDVARGQEQRARAATGSVSNLIEAELAAALFHELRAFLITTAKENPGEIRGPTSVGVITPYREQRALLRKVFQDVVGKVAAAEVMIETVDSFQGKQLDVVIFSCVRAGSGGGLGFITDVRRLNVAITRAKRAMWILGAVGKLRADAAWGALIRDAEARGVVIQDADANSLFPDMEYWQRKAAGTPAPQDQAPTAHPAGPCLPRQFPAIPSRR